MRLKWNCFVLSAIGMHKQFHNADENLMNSEKREVLFLFSILEGQLCVTFTVDDVKGGSGTCA